MTYSPRIDVDAVAAIDVHVHVERDAHGRNALDQELLDASAAYFRHVPNRTPTVPELAETYRDLGMAAVVFTVDATTNLGHPALSSEEIAEECAAYSDVLIPFGSVDRCVAATAVQQATRLVEDHGVRGFKFHPSLQGFAPDDPSLRPLWQRIQELEVPALFHSGQNGIGAGLPGGRGSSCGTPTRSCSTTSRPTFRSSPSSWRTRRCRGRPKRSSMATHKANVFIDLSGWRPKYFPSELVHAAGRQLRDKVLFGSDYPLITPDRWMSDAAELDWPDEVRPAIYKHTAARLLGLD